MAYIDCGADMGISQTLRVTDIPPNLNVYRNMHYFKLDKEKKKWEVLVHRWIAEQDIVPMQQIHMVYEFWFKTNIEHDPDNYACCAKFINDGIVSAGILPRDNFKHIKSLTVVEGGICKQPYILVHLREITEV